MNLKYYKKYEPIFNSWYIVKLIGQGSFGQVYEIERKELGVTYKAALKTITIPQNPGEVKSLLAEGMSKDEVTEYYREMVQTIVNEYILMSKLKGNSNIVSYEDHVLVEHEDGIGWDILIHMELLTPLFDFLAQKTVTRRDVIKLGIDMCKALELCQKYNIVHRDVKPENIFVSSTGNFKLGDFGIAKIIENTGNDMSRKGTYTYMAPEVYVGEPYDSTVDIYSLGIVMYRLLNENRTPFLPEYPQTISFKDKENALIRRISGESIPAPKNADGRLKEIVLKACAHNPKERYGSPLQMRMELEAILYGKDEAAIIYPMGDAAPIKSLKYADTDTTLTDVDNSVGNIKPPQKAKRFITSILIIIISLSALFPILSWVLGGYDIVLYNGSKDDEIILNLESDYTEEIFHVIYTGFIGLIKSKKGLDLQVISSNPDVIKVTSTGEIIDKNLGEATLSVSVDDYCKRYKVKVIKVELNDEQQINVGETKKLELEINPEELKDSITMQYEVDDVDIAEIDDNGYITVKDSGEFEVRVNINQYWQARVTINSNE